MIPDRLIAHNFRPICPGGDDLCGYLDREWRAEKAYLAKRGGDEEPTRVDKATLRTARPQVKPKNVRTRAPSL